MGIGIRLNSRRMVGLRMRHGEQIHERWDLRRANPHLRTERFKDDGGPTPGQFMKNAATPTAK